MRIWGAAFLVIVTVAAIHEYRRPQSAIQSVAPSSISSLQSSTVVKPAAPDPTPAAILSVAAISAMLVQEESKRVLRHRGTRVLAPKT